MPRLVARLLSRLALILLVLLAGSVAFLYFAGKSRPLPAIPSTNGESEDRLEAGRYLTTAGNCYSCHTRPGGEAFAGGVAFHTDFGVIHSTNITPDPETGIGDWSDAEFIRAMHDGISADGQHLYPVFPYTSYTNVSEQDVLAIFSYLKTVEPVNYTPPDNDMDFPYGNRRLMRLWNTLFFNGGRFVADPAKSDEVNRGAYLVQGLGHCGACHSPRNFLGAQTTGDSLIGGELIDEVAPDKMRPWSAVNLTPARNGLADWSKDDIVSYLKTGYSKMAVTFGPMNKVILNSTQHLSDGDRNAMAAYLTSLPPAGELATGDIDEDQMAEGRILYDSYCGTCHLPTGLGDKRTGTPMTGSAVVLARDPASLINSILYGANAPLSLPIPEDLNIMKAFGDELDDEDVAILATFVRNSWGNKASRVTAKQVADQY